MLYINEKLCKGCGICIDLCPKKVFEKNLGKAIVANESQCVKCRICENSCPDFAINLRGDKDE